MNTAQRWQGSRRRLLCLVMFWMVNAAWSADAQVRYEVVSSFGPFSAFGSQPVGGLIEGQDGDFYGTTVAGGALGHGLVFRMTPAGELTILHSFAGGDGDGPAAGVMQASDGSFYGTTVAGGVCGLGTVFRIDAAGHVTTLHSFGGPDCSNDSAGSGPDGRVIQASDGFFYGTTPSGGSSGHGTVFKMAVSAGAVTVTTLHDFTGSEGHNPRGELVEDQGTLVGVTAFGGEFDKGTVFRLDATGALTTLHSFTGADGFGPVSLIRATDGAFYGTTWGGGAAADLGTVFTMNASGSVVTIHSFSGGAEGSHPGSGLIQAADGGFYGTTNAGGAFGQGTVYAIYANGSAWTLDTLHSFDGDGGGPSGVIQARDGKLYGTTTGGSGSPRGSVYTMDAGGAVTTLYRFPPGPGERPGAGVIQATDGYFYGTTGFGGADDRGTVFKMDAAGTRTILHAFTLAEGRDPRASLVQASDGAFYGTTYAGGAHDLGTVFRIDGNGTLTTLHSFAGDDGSHPVADLIVASDGSFYGTTLEGGAANLGTVFRIESGGTLTTLHSFLGGGDGMYPTARLLEAIDGSFYGTTVFGGTGGRGTVFKLDSAGLTIVHSFHGTDGANPAAPLIQARNGEFYGTTREGGFEGRIGGRGTVFRMDASGAVTTLYQFLTNAAYSPTSALVEDTYGDFYGSASGGFGAGVVFKVNDGGAVSIHHKLAGDGAEGAHPEGNMILANDGAVYGTTSSGGAFGAGVVFRVPPPAVRVKSPNRNVKWVIGSTYTVSWAHNLDAGETVAVDLSRDGGVTWTSLSSGVANRSVTSGSFSWTVTGPVTDNGRIRVLWTRDYTVEDISDVDFRIASRITVTEPNKAVIWGAGSTRTVAWMHDLGPAQTFDVAFSPDLGATWLGVASDVPAASATTGVYVTTAPQVLTHEGLIRVSPAGNPGEGDRSNVPLTIQAPFVALTRPDTTATWGIGTLQTVKWQHNLGPAATVDIALSRDGGATWEPLATHVPNEAVRGSYAWTVTAPTTPRARMRVTWSTVPGVTDSSSVNFTIR